MDLRELNDLLLNLGDVLPLAVTDVRLVRCRRQLATLLAAVSDVLPILGDVVVDIELARQRDVRDAARGRHADTHLADEDDAGDHIEGDDDREVDDETDDNSGDNEAA